MNEIKCFTDIDECVEATDKCSSDADCVDTHGSYDCECQAGYRGDGIYCEGLHFFNYLIVVLISNILK